MSKERQTFIDDAAKRALPAFLQVAAIQDAPRMSYDAAEALWAEREARRERTPTVRKAPAAPIEERKKAFIAECKAVVVVLNEYRRRLEALG